MSVPIRLRGGTEDQWTAANPVLSARETGVTTDTHRLKVGDGITEWVDLPYVDEAALEAVKAAALEATDFDHFVTLLTMDS